MSKNATERLENILFGIAMNDDRTPEDVKMELESECVDVDGAMKRTLEKLKPCMDSAKRKRMEP